MKIICTIIVFITFIACQSSPTSTKKTQPDLESWTINLRSVSSHTYTLEGLLEKTHETLYIYLKGQLLDSTRSITLRKYDAHKNLVREIESDIANDNSATPSSEIVYRYDSKNNIIERGYYYKTMLESKQIERYDNQKKNIQTILIQSQIHPSLLENTNRKIVYDTTYQVNELDSEGNVIKIISKNGDGNLIDTHFKSYHKGKSIAAHTINAVGEVTYKSEVSRDGKFDKETTHFMGESNGTTITWRENDKVIKSIDRSTNPETKSKIEYKYNEKGDEIESISYN